MSVTTAISIPLPDALSLCKAAFIEVVANLIPSFTGALALFEAGISSTLAPANRSALKLLEPFNDSQPQIELDLGDISLGSSKHHAILELIVDPQTCGPLAIACSREVGKDLALSQSWQIIGCVV